jgi:oligopeptide/dipeptide ABC transporter ATP-binding protein
MSVATEALFETRGLQVHFRSRGGRVVRALDGVDLRWERGEVLGIVGESGCGKSTLGRTLLGLQRPTGGEVLAHGKPLRTHDLRALRRRVQMVFQDPYQSLNPRMTAADQVREPLAVHRIGSRADRIRRAAEVMEECGLAPVERYWDRYPHELSGGQRQRVAIAAAMALAPEALVCDEPVSALDVSISAQVLSLLDRLRTERGLSLIFITHDVGLAWALCDRVAVMYLGRVVEQGPTAQVLGAPQHPYTRALLSVAPVPRPRPGRRREILAGELPDASRIPSGCRFHPRCPRARDRCGSDDPALMAVGGPSQEAACWYPGDEGPPAP